jgi:hypothetical protein
MQTQAQIAAARAAQIGAANSAPSTVVVQTAVYRSDRWPLPMNKGGDENDLRQPLCKAIITRNRMKYFLVEGDNAARLHGAGAQVVEPHAYGVTHDGSHAILSWRLEARGSGPIAEAGWELVRLDENGCHGPTYA